MGRKGGVLIMELFLPTLNQMGVLGLYIIIGFILGKLRIIPKETTKILSKLENTLFLPALVFYTFVINFNLTTLTESGSYFIFSLIAELIIIPIAIATSKLVSKNEFIQRMYTYGLSFANFGFMGNAVVLAIAPEIYQEYIIFTLPLWTLIYIWGAPNLLMEKDGNEKNRFIKGLKSLINPMFIALIIGAIIGISGLGSMIMELNINGGLFIIQVAKVCGDCMSPIAMLMTGITFAFIDFKKVFSEFSIYLVTFIRLIVFPIVFGGIVYLLKSYVLEISDITYKCFILSISMPLGLNTIVIPAAYGRDTSIPAGMALISHALSILTIPLMILIFF